jgi:excisionase family DNA binding protein
MSKSTASTASGELTEVDLRALVLAVDPGRLRRLRVAHRGDPRLYPALVQLTAIVLGAADGTRLAVSAGQHDAGYATTAEAAALTGLSERAVRRACAEGRITAEKRSGVWLVDRDALTRREIQC